MTLLILLHILLLVSATALAAHNASERDHVGAALWALAAACWVLALVIDIVKVATSGA